MNELIKIPQDVKDFINEVTSLYKDCKNEKVSRMSLEWGVPSAKLNRKIKPKINKKSEEQILYQYCFTYWMTLSHLLETHYKYPPVVKKKGIKRRLGKEATKIKQALSKDNFNILELTEIKQDKGFPETDIKSINRLLKGLLK